MMRTFLVVVPDAEAKHLAGVGSPGLSTAEARCVHAIRNWLTGLEKRRAHSVMVEQVSGDLRAILDLVPQADRPVRGPFTVLGRGVPLPGRVQYLGEGTVRLDEHALSALTSLQPDEDFRVHVTDAGPFLTVSDASYPVREEQPVPGPDP